MWQNHKVLHLFTCFNIFYFNINVFPPEVPRLTVTQPVLLVSVGSDVTLECQATGVPSPLVHWFKGKLRTNSVRLYDECGDNFVKKTSTLFVFSGEVEVGSAPFVEQDVHRGTLRIQGVQEVDAGQYNCVASSSAGTSAGTVSLEVGGKTAMYYTAFHKDCVTLKPKQRKSNLVPFILFQRARCFLSHRPTWALTWGRTSPFPASPEVCHSRQWAGTGRTADKFSQGQTAAAEQCRWTTAIF